MDDVTFGRTAVVGCMAVRYDTGARIYKPCSSIAPVVNTDLSFDESKSQVHRCTQSYTLTLTYYQPMTGLCIDCRAVLQ